MNNFEFTVPLEEVREQWKDWGDFDEEMLMTIDDWKSCVKGGLFIDYDGYGDMVKNDMVCKTSISPSQMNLVPNDVTHIIWYNR